MSERDPFEELHRFGDQLTTPYAPLPPSEVRRLGDRRRTRRTMVVTAAAAAVVVAVAVPFALAGGDDSTKGTDNIATEGPDPTPAPPTAEDKAVVYAGHGVVVSTPADATKLRGTTPEFREFIAAQAAQAQETGASCPDAFHGVTVRKFDPAGYALGGYNDCGGYAALWVVHDGTWIEGLGTQDGWDCDSLDYLQVPRPYVDEPCTDYAGTFGPAGADELTLGMTRAQIEAAHGTVADGPSDSCTTVTFPYLDAVPNQTDGYLSPRHDLVALFARPGMKTPEKVGLGSSEEKVRAAYPDGSSNVHGYWVAPTDGGTYQFGIGEDGTVSEMLIVGPEQDCFG